MEEKIMAGINLQLSLSIGIKLQMEYGNSMDEKRKEEAQYALQELTRSFQAVVGHFPPYMKFARERMHEIYSEQVTAATVNFPPPVQPYPTKCPYTVEELMGEKTT